MPIREGEVLSSPSLCINIFKMQSLRDKGSRQEGYVVRLADRIPWAQHRFSFAKFVRKNHVTSAHNWMNRKVVPNELKEKDK